MKKGLVSAETPFEEILIRDIDLEFVKNVTLTDIYDYLAYLARDRARNIHSDKTRYGLSATSRARKIATIRSYFSYLTVKTKQLEKNPVADLDSPKAKKTLPRYLSLEESTTLLTSVGGSHKERDYCHYAFPELRASISELAGLISQTSEPIPCVFSAKAGRNACLFKRPLCRRHHDYIWPPRGQSHRQARVFLSARKTRITKSTIHNLVKNHLASAGLDASKYSSHKLRHTAATLMLRKRR
jgi:site-specific recombinase XerD